MHSSSASSIGRIRLEEGVSGHGLEAVSGGNGRESDERKKMRKEQKSPSACSLPVSSPHLVREKIEWNGPV